MTVLQSEELIAKRNELQAVVEQSLADVQKNFGRHFEIIASGLQEVADKRNIKLEHDYNPGSRWEDETLHSVTISLAQIFKDLTTSIAKRKLPELTGTGEKPDILNNDHDEQFHYYIYSDFTGLLKFINTEFAASVEYAATKISAALPTTDIEADQNIIAAFALLIGEDGTISFIDELKASADWNRIDSYLEEINGITKKLPEHLVNEKVSTKDLRESAAEILSRLGIKRQDNGRSPGE